MSPFRPSVFLRRALLADALVSGATGILMVAGANFVAGLLGLPASLLQEAGIVLIPYGAAVAFLGTRERVVAAAVWAVIIANGVWAAASVALLGSGLIDPTWLGDAFVTAQALVVALFAALQHMGLHRTAVAAA